MTGGLLGADFEIANGHYRFKWIYTGESWNPQLRAPLSEPGINVKAGEYLLEVAGRALSATDDVYAYLEDTAGKRISLRIGADPSGANARDVMVVPVATEQPRRNRAWIESNRRKMDELSGGTPNMGRTHRRARIPDADGRRDHHCSKYPFSHRIR